MRTVKTLGLRLRKVWIKMRLLLLLSALLAVSIKISGCQGKPSSFLILMRGENVMTQLPTILNRSDIDSNFPYPRYTSRDDDETDKRIELRERGKQVRVIGKYSQVDVRQRPSPPPVYQGHVAIILADRAKVFLHPAWHPNAIRPAEEIARYNHKKVVVVGKMVPEAPESPEGAASLIAPCMLTIDSIELQP